VAVVAVRVAGLRRLRLASLVGVGANDAAAVSGFAFAPMLRLRVVLDYVVEVARSAMFAAIAVHRLAPVRFPINGRTRGFFPFEEGFGAMILYGSSLSPLVRKVLVFAAEKGIGLELQPTGAAPGQHSPEFIAASPVRKMPALRDRDFTLADSSAIVHYLEALHPEPNLIPIEPRARGRVIWFEEYGDTVLMPCGGKMFFNRVVAPTFLGRAGDSAIADAAERDELPPILAYLESVIPDSGFLVEDRLTLADIAIASPLANLPYMASGIDAGRYPRLAAYVSGILARPSFARWIERETALLAKLAA
jgi:glutathione S-transferase